MAQQLTRQGETVALLANFNGASPTLLFPENFPNINKTSFNGSAKPQYVKSNMIMYKLRLIKTRVASLNIKDKLLLPLKILKSIMKLWYSKYLVAPFKQISFSYYKIFKRRMPEKILTSYLLDAMYKSQKSYRPNKYPGEMIVFRSPKIFEEPTLGWFNLLEGEIKTIDIPGEHPNRTYIMHDPFVKFLAEELKKVIP
jgi:hypothetical protein